MAIPNETTLRKQMLQFGRLCYERHLLVAMDGNLSARLPDGNILCTQAGCHKGFLEDEHLVVIDRQGKKLRGKGKPTSEMAMHLACYDERPDCLAVAHAHHPKTPGQHDIEAIAGVTLGEEHLALAAGHGGARLEHAHGLHGAHALEDRVGA